jgi:hypothetical protein
MLARKVVGEGGAVVWLLLTAGMALDHRWFRFRVIGPSPDLTARSRLKFGERSSIRFQPSRVTLVVFSAPNGSGAFLILSTHPIAHQSLNHRSEEPKIDYLTTRTSGPLSALSSMTRSHGIDTKHWRLGL